VINRNGLFYVPAAHWVLLQSAPANTEDETKFVGWRIQRLPRKGDVGSFKAMAVGQRLLEGDKSVLSSMLPMPPAIVKKVQGLSDELTILSELCK
jgi:hypothetical protein